VGRTVVRPAARRDLIRHFAYIGENSSLAIARRFQSAARATFAELAKTPAIGAPGKLAKFPNVRMWRIREFEKHLIFYEPVGDNVEVLRVIHAAQDYNRILNLP
jgi:toxin ParE1/3/4